LSLISLGSFVTSFTSFVSFSLTSFLALGVLSFPPSEGIKLKLKKL